MCGRFNSIASGKDFAAVYDADLLVGELTPNHNVSPTLPIYVLRNGDTRLVLDVMSWGLVPSWSKDKTRAASMINARSETLAEKPSFRNLLAQNRCVLPMQGFMNGKICRVKQKNLKSKHTIFRELITSR